MQKKANVNDLRKRDEGVVRDSAKAWGKERARLGRKGGSEGRDLEVIGEPCFTLKVKVTERRRSCGAHSEYKAD